YIMNSRDLRAVQHVKKLYEIGVQSLKIEGRTKSHFYVARTAQIYRQAIDDAVAGREFDWKMMDALEGLANRGYTEGFYRRHLPAEYKNYEPNTSISATQQFVGEALEYDRQKGLLSIYVKNKFGVGNSLELTTPKGTITIILDAMEPMKCEKLD